MKGKLSIQTFIHDTTKIKNFIFLRFCETEELTLTILMEQKVSKNRFLDKIIEFSCIWITIFSSESFFSVRPSKGQPTHPKGHQESPALRLPKQLPRPNQMPRLDQMPHHPSRMPRPKLFEQLLPKGSAMPRFCQQPFQKIGQWRCPSEFELSAHPTNH